MQRREFLAHGLSAGVLAGLATSSTRSLQAALKLTRLDDAAAILDRAVKAGQVTAASLFVSRPTESYSRAFGAARDDQAMFLLGSISKPIAVAALMTLYDQREFSLDDRVRKFIPAFTGDGRDDVTLQHLLTHVSGLPDQLPENNDLRRAHAPLARFVEGAIRTPLGFAPGSKYQYSSMAILLASRVAELISGQEIRKFVETSVMKPLKMTRSAQGLGSFAITDMMTCQADGAAPESGGGDPTAKQWDWNSLYWRKLGAPWGGTHASAPDVAKFLEEFLHERGTILQPETARLMATNQNPPGFTPRGLGLGVAVASSPARRIETSFGHTGSTGTIAWADPSTKTICVVLTSLPAKAVSPHPRDQVSSAVMESI